MADLKILVVDDEARMRKLVKDFLTRENYIVKEAAVEKRLLIYSLRTTILIWLSLML